MSKKSKTAHLERQWRRYLKDSRLLPREQEKRARLYAEEGQKPPPEKEW